MIKKKPVSVGLFKAQVKQEVIKIELDSCHGPMSDVLIQEYAYDLYLRNGQQPGHDLEDWFQAKACLESSIPIREAPARLSLSATGPAKTLFGQL